MADAAGTTFLVAERALSEEKMDCERECERGADSNIGDILPPYLALFLILVPKTTNYGSLVTNQTL